MAKGNPFLGMARGSAGDFTYYRMMGEQVFRARNRHPSNPRTTLQLIQRCVMLTAQRAYSMLSPLCDHSFQGRTPGTMSQARFTILNNGMMRDALAPVLEDVAHGDETTYGAENNYAGKFSLLPEYMPYIISEGSISPLSVGWNEGIARVNGLPIQIGATTTYAQLVDALGLQAGDQLTFVFMTIDDTTDSGQFNGIKYARIVLLSKDGDMTKTVFKVSENAVEIDPANANEANEGSLYFASIGAGGAAGYGMRFSFDDIDDAEASNVDKAPAACAVIVSRRVGDVWQRSTSRLVLRPYTIGTGNLENDHGVDYLGDAVESFRTESDSTRYLNQAEQL